MKVNYKTPSTTNHIRKITIKLKRNFSKPVSSKLFNDFILLKSVLGYHRITTDAGNNFLFLKWVRPVYSSTVPIVPVSTFNYSSCFIFPACLWSFSGGDKTCREYTDSFGKYHSREYCGYGEFCCGSCNNRYCCSSSIFKLTEDEQEDW